ncbi:MAG TPA: hypothetical protein VFM61_04310 [Pseudidiomarina sp.]|nr:hypothetical protein [Pseudidiomarina sp.]
MNNLLTGMRDRRVLGVFVIVVLLAVLDFVQRVQPSLDTALVERDMAELEPKPAIAEHTMSPRLTDWLASLNVAGGTQQTPAATVQPELLSGGIDIGEKRVRVRAILIANTSQQRIALIEAQDREQRDVEFVELRQGDRLSGYTVSAVQVDGVEFTPNSGDGAVVRVKVFE